MSSFVFFQRREQQLIHAHTERFRISLDLLTLALRDIDTDKKKQENTAPTDNGNPYAGTPDDPLF